ncbi:helix-turn-helix transcriptional regulator [Actinoplanes sp. RD1]|uniref:helix-turn-helix transcriptional regulator n=1 Tax=Actinoplanes sp. RD1 TaxID=3064538 RepID=UPI002741AA13|nr:LuxR family transcriptional regulator [Actinoplanes sp. RD1]
MLIGRDDETRTLTALLERAAGGRGEALVLRGEAGVGKSALLLEASRRAAETGLRVLTVTGVQAEVHVPYAALHPVWPGDDPELPPFRVALALLRGLETAGPALLAVEDVQWLDPASREVLSFLARRVGAAPVAMVLTARDGGDVEQWLIGTGLPDLAVEPLSPADAGALLDTVAPGLTPALRARVLEEAAGNPLGLTELGAVAARDGAAALLPAYLPLTTRVERTFAGLVAELPAATRTLLLCAALNDGDDLAEALAATGIVHGPVGAADIEPAVLTRLVRVGTAYRIGFRHPLLRSALQQGAAPGRRREVHAALAAVVVGADRRVWHRASATDGPDEELARELTEAAVRAEGRQAAGIAVLALERAAQLSLDPALRGRRLLWAADQAGDMGDLATVRRLLDAVEPAHLRSVDRARFAALREHHIGSNWDADTSMETFAAYAAALREEDDKDLALDWLCFDSTRFYWAAPDAATRALFVTTAEGLGFPPGHPRLLAALGLLAPIERGAPVLAGMRTLATRPDLSPIDHFWAGVSTSWLGDPVLSEILFAGCGPALRAQGRIATLGQLLFFQATNAVYRGDPRRAVALSDEAIALLDETRQIGHRLAAGMTLAHAWALRGEREAALRVAGEAEQVLLPAGRLPMLACVQEIRGVAALGAGQPAEAYRELRRIFDPADIAHHPSVRFVTLAHLAEAAVRCRAHDDLRALVAELTPVAELCESPALRAGLRYAHAALAGTAEAYERALAEAPDDWPFERARLQLAYGSHLRRHRRVAASRAVLRAAESTFDGLGATPWADQARTELRASGETIRRTAAALTPQEQRIAELAAAGLSNREIAERLFLSPRTVTTHLSRIYPKLGIRSRAGLSRPGNT